MTALENLLEAVEHNRTAPEHSADRGMIDPDQGRAPCDCRDRAVFGSF